MPPPDLLVRPRSEDPGHRPYDFGKPLAYTPRQLNTLRENHGVLVSLLSDALSALIGEPVRVTENSTDEVLGDDFTRSREVPAVHFRGVIGSHAGHYVALDLSPPLALYLVERALGGGDPLGDVSRPLSALEVRVVERQAIPIIEDSLSRVWEYTAVRFDAYDSNPRRLPVSAPEASVVVCMFDVSIGSATVPLTLCYSALALRHLLADARPSLSTEPQSFSDVPVDIQANFGHARLPVGDLARLAPGDVIPLTRAPEAPLHVSAGDYLHFHAVPGTAGSRLALQLVSAPAPLASPRS